MPETAYQTGIKPEHFTKLVRYQKLSTFRKYLKGKQYEGRPDFFTGQRGPREKPVPLRERAPCIIYPLPKSAVNQVVRFTFGESRFPTINVEATAEGEDAVLGLTLSEAESETLERYIANVVEDSELKPTMRRVMRPGLAVGTVVAILSIRSGKFRIDVANAEDCFPTFKNDDPREELVSVTWSYQYDRTVTGALGPEVKRYWYRQDIDAKAFTTYQPEEVLPGVAPKWNVDKTIDHRFGFCPARWIRNLIDEDCADVDGVSLYEDLLEQFDALNFALSQRHRGIHHFGTPQPWETGVDDDDGPGATGRQSAAGYSPGNAKTPHGTILGADGRPARKAGPDHVWSFRSKDAKVGVAETTGKAFEAASLHVNDVRGRVLEAMSVVLVNVSEIMGKTHQGQMSAKFLELAYEPLLALVDEMRHCWWPEGLRAIISMILRATAARPNDLFIAGAQKAGKLLARFLVNTTEGPMWLPPKMSPSWGDYFAAGPDEIGQAVTTAQLAKDAHLVPAEDAVKFVLPYFGREDVQDALDEIADDKAQAMVDAQTAMQQEAATLHAAANGNPPGGSDKPGSKKSRPGKPSPNAPPGGGDGGAPPGTTPAGGP